jgi:hypothetical protein
VRQRVLRQSPVAGLICLCWRNRFAPDDGVSVRSVATKTHLFTAVDVRALPDAPLHCSSTGVSLNGYILLRDAGHAAAAPMGQQEMKGIPRYVRPFSLLTMILLAVNCVCSGGRAENIAAAPQVWVTVTSVPVIHYPRWNGIRTDAPDQWRPDAAWQTVASHTKVAKLIAGNIENARDTDLQTTLADVRRRHLELALEIGPLVRSAISQLAVQLFPNVAQLCLSSGESRHSVFVSC